MTDAEKLKALATRIQNTLVTGKCQLRHSDVRLVSDVAKRLEESEGEDVLQS